MCESNTYLRGNPIKTQGPLVFIDINALQEVLCATWSEKKEDSSEAAGNSLYSVEYFHSFINSSSNMFCQNNHGVC